MSTMDDSIFRLFAGLPLQGPGSDRDTIAVLDRIRARLPAEPSIADFGCGTGRSSLALAEALPGAHLRAIDAVPLFVDRLREEAERCGLTRRLRAETGDMLVAPIVPGSLDLIWSEGAAYAVGFETALRAWRPLLKASGICVLSECEWLSGERPAQVAAFWRENYPDMYDRAQNVRRAEAAGFAVLHCQVLSDEGWSSYYNAISQALADDGGRSVDPEFQASIAREIEARGCYGLARAGKASATRSTF